MRPTFLLITALLACTPQLAHASCVQVMTYIQPYRISQSGMMGHSTSSGWVWTQDGAAMGSFGARVAATPEIPAMPSQTAGCSLLGHFRVRLHITDTTIALPRSFAPGSCAYKAAVTHAIQHYQAYRAALQQSGPQLQAKLGLFLQRYAAGMAAENAATRPAAEAALEQLVQQHVAEFENELQQANRQIEAQSDIRRALAACP